MDGTVFAFLFAHPDDDVFIAGTMRLLMERGSDVHGVWATDGNFMGQGSVRMRELATASGILGLNESRVHLLNQPDLGMIRDLDRAADAAAKLIRTIQPDAICVTAFEGGHPDHDLTNFLAYEASHRAGIRPKIYEFPLYNGTGPVRHWRWRINAFPADGLPTRYTRLYDDAIRRKHSMMRAYASQWMFMIPARLACPWQTMLNIGEPFRESPIDRDHALPPHPGQLNYERWFNGFLKTRFPRFRTAVERARTRPIG
jgi:LmbE family N-acetylglucosaminyl deacetylase